MKTFSFTIVTTLPVGDGGDDFERVAERLFEAGLDDGTVSGESGFIAVDLDREADSFAEAITSALQQLQRAQLPVSHIVDDWLVSLEEIASRLDRTRQSVQHWVQGTRGPGGFPVPHIDKSPHIRLWRWEAVADWLAQADLLSITERNDVSSRGDIITALNGVLATRRLPEPAQRHLTALAAS